MRIVESASAYFKDLSAEDMVTLEVMVIMKRLDTDIQRQGNILSASREFNRMSLLATGSSVDLEMMKLKRMIDQRGQMFDMLRQIIDRDNERAKNIIQSIGR